MKRILKARIVILFILLTFVPFGVPAKLVAELYQTKVFLNDRSTEELNRGFSEALVKVLIKLTGQSQISLNLPWVKTLIDGAESFIERYSFEPVSKPSAGLNLLATFDKKILTQELETLEIRQWNSVRPTILFKLVGNSENLSKLNNFDKIYYERINHKAIDRGLPVATFKMPKIQPNSRYPNELKFNNQDKYPGSVEFAINVGANNDIEIDATLMFLEEKQKFNFIEVDPETAASKLVDLVADYVAKTVLLNFGETKTQEVVLEFFNVNSRKEFERLLAYLSELEQIENIFIRSVEATSLKLEIIVKGGLRGFEQSVLYSEVLRKISNRNLKQYNFLDKGR